MGIEPLFHSLVEGDHVDNAVIVAGYVIMRLALVFQWLRAARQDPAHRQTCRRYASYLGTVQLGWIAVLIIQADVPTTLAMTVPLFVLEMATPYVAERSMRTPWHAHHIFAAIAATGAGLHVAAYYIDHEAHISAAVAVASIAVPVAIFKVSLTALFSGMICVDRTVVGVAAGVLAALAGSVGLAAAGVSVPVCLLVIVLALGISIVIDERLDTSKMSAALEQMKQRPKTYRPS